ncbi:hypothetical protein, partial [Mycobacterium tuberculosis]
NSTTDGVLCDWYGTGTDQIGLVCTNADNGSYETAGAGTGNATWKIAFTLYGDGNVVSSVNGGDILTDEGGEPAGPPDYTFIGCRAMG